MKRHLLVATALAGGLGIAMTPSVKADELSDLKSEMGSMKEELKALRALVKTQGEQQPAQPQGNIAAQPQGGIAAQPQGGLLLSGGGLTMPALTDGANTTPAPTPFTFAGIPLVSTPYTHMYIGGILDAGYRIDGGTKQGTVQSINSGQSRTSRLTIEGYQELPHGLRAVAGIEAGMALDTGTGTSNPPNSPAGSFTFGRFAAVGLGRDDWGYVTFGRQYAPIWSVSASGMNDPFGGMYLGGIGTLYNTTIRASNAVVYSYGYSWETMLDPAPKAGLGVAAMYSAGEASAPAPSDSGEEAGVGLSYGGQGGKWWVGYAYHQVRGSNGTISATAPVTSSPMLRQHSMGASYDLGPARLFAGGNMGFNGNDNARTGGVDSWAWDVGATVPVTKVQLVRFLYGKKYDQTSAKAGLSTAQISYEYTMMLPQLSTQTYKPSLVLYVLGGLIDNSPNSAASLTGASTTVSPGAMAKTAATGFRFVF